RKGSVTGLERARAVLTWARRLREPASSLLKFAIDPCRQRRAVGRWYSPCVSVWARGTNDQTTPCLLCCGVSVGGRSVCGVRRHRDGERLQAELPGHEEHLRAKVQRRSVQDQVLDRPQQLHRLLRQRHGNAEQAR